MHIPFLRPRNSKEMLPLKASELERMPYFFDLATKTRSVDGDVVETGVGWGKSLIMLACCMDMLKLDRNIYGFDSFSGFPEPHELDLGGKARKGHYKTSMRFVRHRLDSYSMYTKKINLVRGYVEATLKNYQGKIAILHIDLDIYEGYKTTLDTLYPLVEPGGIIAFDEYQSNLKWPGAKKAVDQFIERTGETLQKSTYIDRYYIIKK